MEVRHACHWLTISGPGAFVPLGYEDVIIRTQKQGQELKHFTGAFWERHGGSLEHVLDVKDRGRCTRVDIAIDVVDGPDPWAVHDAFRAGSRRQAGWRSVGSKLENPDGTRGAYFGRKGSSPVRLCVYNRRGPTRFEFRFSRIADSAERAIQAWREGTLWGHLASLLWFYPEFGKWIEAGPACGLPGKSQDVRDRELLERVDVWLRRNRRMLGHALAVYGDEFAFRLERVGEAAIDEFGLTRQVVELPF